MNWIDYLRSRIRLARALARYGPAMTVSMTFGVWRCLKEPMGTETAYLALVGITAAYIMWAVLGSSGKEFNKLFGEPTKKRISKLLSKPLPRTDERQFIDDYAKTWGAVDMKKEEFVKLPKSDLCVWVSEWRILCVPVVLLAVAFLLAFNCRKSPVWLSASTGAGITVLSAWSWWRISFTFRSYLHDLQRYPKQTDSGRKA